MRLLHEHVAGLSPPGGFVQPGHAHLGPGAPRQREGEASRDSKTSMQTVSISTGITGGLTWR